MVVGVFVLYALVRYNAHVTDGQIHTHAHLLSQTQLLQVSHLGHGLTVERRHISSFSG